MTDDPPVVRLAAAADLPALARIEREAFADPWGADALAAYLGVPGVLVLVAKSAGAAIGYALFQRAAGEVELLRIGVSPGARGLGHGARLLEAGLRRLRAAGDVACFLEVRDGNVSARRLYERAGFVVTGHRRGYYADGEDARLYRLDLVPPTAGAG